MTIDPTGWPWYTWLLAVAATVTAIRVIWDKAIAPTWEAVLMATRLRNAAPALIQFAEDYLGDANGTRSFRQMLTDLQEAYDALNERAETQWAKARHSHDELSAEIAKFGEQLEEMFRAVVGR